MGAPGQQALKGPWALNMAINEYMKKHREKTSEGYVELDIKYDEENEKEESISFFTKIKSLISKFLNYKEKPKVEKKTSKLGKEKKKESKLSKPVQVSLSRNPICSFSYSSKKFGLGTFANR